MNQRKWYLCALAFVVLYLSTALILPLTRGESPIKLGSDLSGGVLVTYRPDFSSVLDSHRDMTHGEILSSAKEELFRPLTHSLDAMRVV